MERKFWGLKMAEVMRLAYLLDVTKRTENQFY
jgi:hypothetical protein